MADGDDNGRVTLAVIDTKLDRVIKNQDSFTGTLEKHDTRIRANEIGVAKLTVLVGGSAGIGGLIGAIISAAAGLLG